MVSPPNSSQRRLKRSAKTPIGILTAAPARELAVTSNPSPVLSMRSERSSWTAIAPIAPLLAPFSARTAARTRITRFRAGPPSLLVSPSSTLRTIDPVAAIPRSALRRQKDRDSKGGDNEGGLGG
jgi:hypothetical protein